MAARARSEWIDPISLPSMAKEMSLANKANCEAADLIGRTPLIVAVEKGHEDAGAGLLAYHANTSASNLMKSTPLYLAALSGRINAIKLLLEPEAAPTWSRD